MNEPRPIFFVVVVVVFIKFSFACKVAKLKRIFKKEIKPDPSNYRLISLLLVITKIIEKVIYDQTNDFLSNENIFYNYQSIFRANHSTNLCLSFLTDKILKGFDEGLLTGMILIDLQKAFDTIDHEILLHKLKAIRFSKGTLQWFRSYLSERIFLVNIESKLSDFGKKFLWSTTRVYLRPPFVFDLCERYATNSRINFTFICR